MRNFSDQPLCTKEFTVLNNDEKPNKEITEQPIDVQFFAEGGSFIADIENRMGIKTTAPNGHGIETSGSILNSKGDTVQHFSTNKYGLGDVLLLPVSGEHYKAIVSYNKNKTLETKLPELELKGIGLSVT